MSLLDSAKIKMNNTHSAARSMYSPKNFIITLFLSIIGLCALVIYLHFESAQKINELAQNINEIDSTYENLSKNLEEDLFEDHLKLQENIKLRGEMEALRLELEALRDTSTGSTLTRVNAIYTAYQGFQSKLSRNENVKLDVDSAKTTAATWGALLIDKKYDEIDTSIVAENTKLDEEYKKYLATLPPPVTSAGSGYSYVTVDTERGSFGVHVIKVSKSSVSVKTLAAAEDDCEDNCPTKSLQEYANDNGAFAAIAGSYSCPADYASCAGKVWSFDFALYDTNDGKWLNEDALSWGDTGLITFNGSSSKGYEETSEYGGGGVSAGISNFPMLLAGGNVVVSDGDVDSFQQSKGTRGAIGTDDNNIYLAYVTRASVIDAAFAMKALGAETALNLDGGGSAAMYINGRYVVGPGRPLPNAVLLIQ